MNYSFKNNSLIVIIAGIRIAFITDNYWTIELLHELLQYHEVSMVNSDYLDRHMVYIVEDDVFSSKGNQKSIWTGALNDGTEIVLISKTRDELIFQLGPEVQIEIDVNRNISICKIKETTFRNKLRKRPQPGGYFFPVIQVILSIYDKFVIHSSCISLNHQSALLIGESGSGKSTLSILLCREGFEYMSDDLTIVEGTNGDILSHSLLIKSKIVLENMEKEYFDAILNYNLNYIYESRLSCIIKINRIKGCHTFLHRMSPVDTFKTIMDSGTNLNFLFNGDRFVDVAAQISKRRGYVLHFGDKERFNSKVILDALNEYD